MLPGFIYFLIKIVFLQLYPAYASYKAIKFNKSEQLSSLLKYWVVVSALTAIEGVADIFVFWIPFYNDIKALLIIWLVLPQTQGSVYIYNNLIDPYLLQNEPKIDRWLTDAQDNVSRTSLNLGKRGLKAVQNAALETFKTPLSPTDSQSQPQTPPTLSQTLQSVLLSSLFNAASAATTPPATSPTASSITNSSNSVSAAAAPPPPSLLNLFPSLNLLTTSHDDDNNAADEKPIIHPSSLGDTAVGNLTPAGISAERARLEAALRQLNEKEKRSTGGVVVVEGYGKEERVEEFSAEEDDQEPPRGKNFETKKMV